MKAREFIQFILGLPPAAVVQYLDEKPSLASDDDQQTLWKGLADAFETRARMLACAGEKNPLALEWAAISIKLHQRLAKEAHSEYWRESHLSSEMSVRCGMISLLSPLADHPVLDPDPLEELFFSATGFKLETVSQAREQLAALRVEDVFRRAELNGRLALLQPLIARGVFRRNEELRAWEDALFGQQTKPATSRSVSSLAHPVSSDSAALVGSEAKDQEQ